MYVYLNMCTRMHRTTSVVAIWAAASKTLIAPSNIRRTSEARVVSAFIPAPYWFMAVSQSSRPVLVVCARHQQHQDPFHQLEVVARLNLDRSAQVALARMALAHEDRVGALKEAVEGERAAAARAASEAAAAQAQLQQQVGSTRPSACSTAPGHRRGLRLDSSMTFD